MDLAQSSLKLFVANTLSAVFQFLGITYFARELGPAPMGVFFLFQALLGMLAIPADFGLRGAVEKRISEGESQGVFLSSAFALKAVPIGVIVIVILLFRPFLNSYLGADIAIFLAVAIIIQEVAQLSIVVLKGELRVGETAVLQIARQATWVGVGAVLVSQGLGAVGLVYGLLAGLGVILVWGWYKVSVVPERPSREHARSLFDYGKYNVVSSIGGYFYSWMDVAIIGLFLTQAHVGAYEIAWRVSAITMLFSRAIASTLFPQVSQWDTEDTKEHIESVIHKSIGPSMLLVIPAFFGSMVFSHKILGLVFGEKFTIASTVLVILMGEKIVQSVHIILGRVLQGINRPELAARATVISVCLNLVLNIALITFLGIVGAAIATTLSFAINMLLHGRYLSQHLDIHIPYSEIGWLVLSSMVMAMVLLGVRQIVAVETLLQLLVVIGFGAIIYVTFVLLFRPIQLKAYSNLRALLFSGS